MKKINLSKFKDFLNINSTKFKISIVIIFMLYLIIIFKISLLYFNTTDKIPELKAINTEVLKSFGPFTVRTKVGMFIKNFPVFDINKNSFLVDSVIWFEFNPDETMLETIEKFSIDKGKIITKSSPDIKIINDKMFVKYNVLFDLKTDLSFSKFPLEDHRIPIVLSNDFITPNEMYFSVDASSFQILPNLSPTGWTVNDTHVDAGFLPLQLDSQDLSKKAVSPKALFVIDFVKSGVRKILIIFIPLFFAAFLSLLSFVMNVENVVGKFRLSISAVTALLGYRFVIERIMPQVSYFTSTDSIYTFLLIFAFIIFLIQLLLTRHFMVTSPKLKEEQETKFKKKIEQASSIIFIIMSILLVITTTYIILI